MNHISNISDSGDSDNLTLCSISVCTTLPHQWKSCLDKSILCYIRKYFDMGTLGIFPYQSLALFFNDTFFLSVCFDFLWYLYYKLWLSLFGFRSLFLFSTGIDLKHVLAEDRYQSFCYGSKTKFWYFPIQCHFIHDQDAVLEAMIQVPI